MSVLVFHTSIYLAADVQMLANRLSRNPFIHRWNVDLGDCRQAGDPSVLRVETDALLAKALIETVQQLGFCCEELTD